MEIIISEMSGSWIVDDVSSSDGGDISTWEMIDGPDLSSSSDDDEFDFPSLLSQSPPKKKPIIILDRLGCSNNYNYRMERCHVDGHDDDELVDDDDDDDEVEVEVDDEMVPKGFRLERNRMRKVGKREYSRMARSKKLPVVYNKPGCVRGKHGLGLKHCLI